MLDNALREPAARWESEGIGIRLATDYRKAQHRRRGTSEEATKNEGPVFQHLCWADGTVDHLTRILGDMTNSIERLGMQWKEKSLTIVAGPYTEYKPGDVVEIISNNGRRWVWRVVEGMEALGTAGQAWLLGGQHVAHNFQSQLHVFCEEGLVLRSQTAGQEAYSCFLLDVCGCGASWCW